MRGIGFLNLNKVFHHFLSTGTTYLKNWLTNYLTTSIKSPDKLNKFSSNIFVSKIV